MSNHPSLGLTVEREPITREDLDAHGIDLEKDFPGSTVSDFKQYPVLSDGGWFMVIKHQPTLTSVSREPWKLLGPIELTSHDLHIG